jgi:prolipoprotein diacylglyceryltransferase
VAIMLGFISAMLFQLLFDSLKENSTNSVFSMTFFGGLVGGVITFIIGYFFYIKKRYPECNFTSDVLIIAPACITVAHGFGRIGCFLAGCCYGKQTDSIWGVKFPHLNHNVFPTQLYEAIAYFITFAVLLFIYIKQKTRVIPGTLFSLFLILAFTSRLIIENWKEVQEAWEANMALNMGQILSIPFIAIGIVILILSLLGKTGKPLEANKVIETHKNK